jgi:hypothetical protein
VDVCGCETDAAQQRPSLASLRESTRIHPSAYGHQARTNVCKALRGYVCAAMCVYMHIYAGCFAYSCDASSERIGALDGHADGVFSCCSVRNKLAPFISGACDGELRVWDLPSRKCVWSARAHAGFVRGVTADAQGESFFSCSDDKSIKQWPLTAFVDAEVCCWMHARLCSEHLAIHRALNHLTPFFPHTRCYR